MKKILIGLTLLVSMSSFGSESKKLTDLIIACTQSADVTYKTVEKDKYSSDDYVISIQCFGNTTAKPLYDELIKESYSLVKDDYISTDNRLVNLVLLGDDKIGLDTNQVSKCIRVTNSNNTTSSVYYKCYINLDLRQGLIKKMKATFNSTF